MPKIKVLLIEDNRLLREGIAKMLNAEEDIKVLSSSGNGDALEKAKMLVPDVVLLDLGLKNQNSLTIVGAIKNQFPATNVVVMDLIPAHAEVVEFVKAGVAGFILKDATLQDFLRTIRSVAKGAKVLPPDDRIAFFSDRGARASRRQNGSTDVCRQIDRPGAGGNRPYNRREKQ